jgi:plastocyanin
MKAFIISIVAVLIIGGGGYAIFHKSPRKTNTTTSSQNATDTITFDGTQFSPATLTVKSGAVLKVKNTSPQDLQMDSDPHPVHTDDTDLNVGLVSPGQSKTFTVTKIGSFGYHDHLDPSIHAKITIE